VAVVLALASPWLAMLYLGRPARAGVYFALSVLLPLGVFLLAWQGFWPARVSWTALSYVLGLVGIVDAIRIAGQYTTTFTGPWFTAWYGLVAIAVALIALAISFRIYLFEPFHTPSGAMLPTLQVGDQFVVSKGAYRSAPPQRGDVIVFELPNEGVSYVKRVVGLPGDVVVYEAASKRLIINGVMAGIETQGPYSEHDTELVRETIDGRPHLQLHTRGGLSAGGTYTVPAGHYFVLGDHRDNSRDSRYSEFSFVPSEAIFGKVTLVFWNTDEPARAGTVVD
jgi:signal peptidase I